MRQLIYQINKHTALYRDDVTGIAWVENGSTGNGHSAHPNIHETGSIRGMKSMGHWGKDDRCVKSGGYIYNIDMLAVSDQLDNIARIHCRCGGEH